MAKMNPYDRRHRANLTMYQKMIEAIYNSAAAEAAQIAANTRGIDTETPFRFDDYPQTRKRVAELMARLKSRISVTVVNGIDAEWTLANNKNNELANRVFGDNVGRLSQAAYRRYYSTNDNARQAFQQRKVGGLNLSERVWCYAEQFREEIEMGLDVGLRNGLSADQMSRDLRSYLRHPDKLFRRVRDERGQLHLSKAAAAFHPGRGVYRSSYMNARRLAATETNIAYRTSDHTRWQQMDFVVGIEIVLSNNHTCKGADGKPHPFHDICDELAGRYPKDFKFTGWHPHCRCHAVSILKTPKEIAEDTRKIMNGEAPDTPSVNEVKDVPPAFRDWLANNSDRIEAAAQRGTTPYFIKDNELRVNNIINDPAGEAVRKTDGVGYDWERIIRGLDDDALEEYTNDMFDNARERRAFVRANEGKLADRVVEYIQQQQDPEYPDYLQIEYNIYRAMQKAMKLPDDFDELFDDYKSGYYKQFNSSLRRGETPAHSKLVKALDEATQQNELPANMILTRYVGNDYLASNFGATPQMSADDIVGIVNSHIGKTIIDNAYVSTSAIVSNNVMSHMECKLKILAPKGSRGCITNNITESEILLPRGQSFEVLGACTYMSSQGNISVEVTLLLK